jgi:Spy/CpxP family protein refolding chaperone
LQPAGSDKPWQKEKAMHPAFVYFWGRRHFHGYGPGHGHGHGAAHGSDESSCGPGGGRGFSHCGPGGGPRESGPPDFGDGDGDGGGGGGAFGVRRPLRFLAYKLDLDEKQVAELARVLNDLKTERAQGEVDHRRSLTAFADAVAGETFDGAKATEGARLRVSSAERLRDAVLSALQQIHAALSTEQRAKLAYLIRTGTLTL